MLTRREMLLMNGSMQEDMRISGRSQDVSTSLVLVMKELMQEEEGMHSRLKDVSTSEEMLGKKELMSECMVG